MEAMVPNHWHDLFQYKNKKNQISRAKNNVVCLEKACKFERFLVFHDSLDREDDKKVGSYSRKDDFVG
jgi:hypothetical protein